MILPLSAPASIEAASSGNRHQLHANALAGVFCFLRRYEQRRSSDSSAETLVYTGHGVHILGYLQRLLAVSLGSTGNDSLMGNISIDHSKCGYDRASAKLPPTYFPTSQTRPDSPL
jgi:hypothetical protein